MKDAPSTRVLIKVAAAVAGLFGVATIIAGTGVLMGTDPGYVVYRPLLLFNTLMGVVYVGTAVAIWRKLRLGTYAAGAVFALNVLVLVAVALLYRSGGGVAIDSLRAMGVRTFIWLVIFIATSSMPARRERL